MLFVTYLQYKVSHCFFKHNIISKMKHGTFIFCVKYLKFFLLFLMMGILIYNVFTPNLDKQFLNSNGSIKTKRNCTIILKTYSTLPVSWILLCNLMISCHTKLEFQHRYRFNMSFLNKTLKNFSCPCTLKYVPPQKSFIALASLPGSGNTMTRFLIQSVTGFTTSFISKNKVCPFNKENFLVKTHRSDDLVLNTKCIENNITKLVYRKAVFILRNPYYAILSEYKRRHSWSATHEPELSKTFFLTEDWKIFVRVKSERWKEMAIYWLSRFDKPTHLVIYENMVNSPLVEMFFLLQFLGIKVDFQSLYCVSASCVENKNRLTPLWMHNLTLFDIYDYHEIKMINTHIVNTSRILNRKVITNYVLS